MEFTIVSHDERGEPRIESIEVEGTGPAAFAAEGGGVADFAEPETAARAGRNGRQVASPKSSWPPASVCNLSVSKSTFTDTGTGGIMFRRMILTAAHVVLELDPSGSHVVGYPPVQIYPGFPEPRTGLRPYLNNLAVIFPTAYARDVKNNRHLDCAILVTREDTTSFQNLGLWVDGIASGPKYVWAYGYPQRKGAIVNRYNDNGPPEEMFAVSGQAQASGKLAYMADNDFHHGASGGPWMAQGTDGQWYCVGVNAQENPGPRPDIDQSDPGVYSPLFGGWTWDMALAAKKKRDEG